MHICALSDRQLIDEVARAVADERHSTIRLIRLLAALEERGLHFGEGYSSMFSYCTGALRLSEHAAYGRITAARASRRFPQLIDLLEHGEITLTTVVLLAPRLNESNADGLIQAARRKSKDQVAKLIAAAFPRPDVPSLVRKVSETLKSTEPAEAVVAAVSGSVDAPQSIHVNESVAPAYGSTPEPDRTSQSGAPAVGVVKPPATTPLSAQRYLIRVTVSAQAHENLRRAQDLLGHSVPGNDPAAVIERALAVLVEQLERTRLAKVDKPRPARMTRVRSRSIPASVKREVWRRDAGRCAFVGTHGRCAETRFLEFHHVQPFAAGGLTTTENLSLRCRAHNGYEARIFYGESAKRAGPK